MTKTNRELEHLKKFMILISSCEIIRFTGFKGNSPGSGDNCRPIYDIFARIFVTLAEHITKIYTVRTATKIMRLITFLALSILFDIYPRHLKLVKSLVDTNIPAKVTPNPRPWLVDAHGF